MDNKTKDALKQLQAEIRQLQSVLVEKRPEIRTEGPPVEEEGGPRKEKISKEAVVMCEVNHLPPGGSGAAKRLKVSVSMAQLSHVTNAAAAALGYALASPQKVALLRALLAQESESAAALGEVTGLTTGSLYHHLRELMRADLVLQSGRNCYILTDRGVLVLNILLALAVE